MSSRFEVNHPEHCTILQGASLVLELATLGLLPKLPAPSGFTIGIFTILGLECEAVRDVFQLQAQEHALGERLYYSGTAQGQKGSHRIVMTQVFSQGETSIISAYYDMVHRYHPDIVLLLGIAGGISPKSRHCDVIVANQIISYDLQKDTETGAQRRGETYRINAAFFPLLQALQEKADKGGLPAADGSPRDTIRLKVAPIGSGSAVVAHKLSAITRWIHEYNDKTEAVEMEAAGISSALYEDCMRDDAPKYGLVCIRGISDLADAEKAAVTQYRVPAAVNAAIIAKELLLLLS